MRTVAETVGRIKQILTGSLADAQETRSVAQEFTQLCIGAQKRLDQCVGLLARGLRTEAIYAAEAAPNLIDLIGKLDFPDAVAWREYVARIPLPVPPPFDVNALQTLDAEWGRHADVEPLVARYRTLCVRRAPVADRITVLRQVRSADGGNPNWGKDLAALETVRFKEIRLALRTIPTEEEAAGYLRELTAARRCPAR